jgi:hypothetical protein
VAAVPDSFLPVAEQTGLMRPLASTVLQIALQQTLEWRRTGLDISVAVNLSVANLIDTHLPVEGRQPAGSLRPARQRAGAGDHRNHADGRRCAQLGFPPLSTLLANSHG